MVNYKFKCPICESNAKIVLPKYNDISDMVVKCDNCIYVYNIVWIQLILVLTFLLFVIFFLSIITRVAFFEF